MASMLPSGDYLDDRGNYIDPEPDAAGTEIWRHRRTDAIYAVYVSISGFVADAAGPLDPAEVARYMAEDWQGTESAMTFIRAEHTRCALVEDWPDAIELRRREDARDAELAAAEDAARAAYDASPEGRAETARREAEIARYDEEEAEARGLVTIDPPDDLPF